MVNNFYNYAVVNPNQKWMLDSNGTIQVVNKVDAERTVLGKVLGYASYDLYALFHQMQVDIKNGQMSSPDDAAKLIQLCIHLEDEYNQESAGWRIQKSPIFTEEKSTFERTVAIWKRVAEKVILDETYFSAGNPVQISDVYNTVFNEEFQSEPPVEEIDRILRESEDQFDQKIQNEILQKQFIQELYEKNGWVVRESIDNGDCLFASCLESPSENPTELRCAVYQEIEANVEHFKPTILMLLREDVESITDPARSETQREQELQKLPQNIHSPIREIAEFRKSDEGQWEQFMETWLSGAAFYEYVNGMKETRAYPGLIEIAVLSKILNRPIRVHERGRSEEAYDAVPSDGENRSCNDPDTLHLLYDAGRKHFDRLNNTDHKIGPSPDPS